MYHSLSETSTPLEHPVSVILEVMKCLRLLFMCCCSSVLAVSSCTRVDGYSCVSDYRRTVTCVLNITGNPMEKSNYSLEFSDSDGINLCPLVAVNHTYSCVCKLSTADNLNFDSYSEYNIMVCHVSDCHPVTKKFEPAQNIQLTPPHKAEVQITPKTFSITWTSGYEDRQVLKDILEYELLLQTPHSQESHTLSTNKNQKNVSVQRSQLKPDATYCVKVRSKVFHSEYSSIWSEWGPSTCWKNEAVGDISSEQDNTTSILTKSLGPMFVAVGVLLFVFYRPYARMKIRSLSHTPSPAPFFKPLFQQYEGNLQEWFSPHGKFVLTYETEEILTTDTVIVEPKPIAKEPDEDQKFLSASITQPEFTQCQTSYVGLPGIHEASPPLTVVSPGNMSYTQLPCSVWGVGFGEEKVVSSSPKDFLDISHADSGCSCEDLTQSPECSLPNSPVDVSPPPCNSTGYCILNKTAEGFAPVLVSEGSNLSPPSDSPQENKS
uniref:interleukin-21 receptor-like n=1 Tax=Scatophagus argus TaxID=75038 RepID=UPI001ED819F5|nr:interleukin-21 receptor-like [Scatophagus argus]